MQTKIAAVSVGAALVALLGYSPRVLYKRIRHIFGGRLMNEDIESQAEIDKRFQEFIPRTLHKDPLLVEFVKWANIAEIGLPVTLLVQGYLVSGITCSQMKFLETTRSMFLSHDQDESNLPDDNYIVSYFSNFIEGCKTYKEIYDVNIPEHGDAIFLHLKDARFFKGNEASIPRNGVLTWRVRIQEIAGFHMGTFMET
jgi:hypothetical protein